MSYSRKITPLKAGLGMRSFQKNVHSYAFFSKERALFCVLFKRACTLLSVLFKRAHVLFKRMRALLRSFKKNECSFAFFSKERTFFCNFFGFMKRLVHSFLGLKKLYISIYILKKRTMVGHAFFCALCKRNRVLLRSFAFFSKECAFSCALVYSL